MDHPLAIYYCLTFVYALISREQAPTRHEAQDLIDMHNEYENIVRADILKLYIAATTKHKLNKNI